MNTVDTTNWMDLKDIMLSETKPMSEDNIMCNPLSKHQNYSDREQISGCQGLRLMEKYGYTDGP